MLENILDGVELRPSNTSFASANSWNPQNPARKEQEQWIKAKNPIMYVYGDKGVGEQYLQVAKDEAEKKQ